MGGRESVEEGWEMDLVGEIRLLEVLDVRFADEPTCTWTHHGRVRPSEDLDAIRRDANLRETGE